MSKVKITKAEINAALKKKWYFYIIELVLLGGIIAGDLCSKDALEKLMNFEVGSSRVFIKGFMNITYSQNTGAGFGSFKNNTVLLIVVTALVVAVMLVFLVYAFRQSEWLRVPIVMIAAGGIGNLVDRIALGYVRDFFEFTFVRFAIFNVADSFVTVGAVWLVIVLIVMLIKEGNKNKKAFANAKNDVSDATDDHSERSDDLTNGIKKETLSISDILDAPPELNKFLSDDLSLSVSSGEAPLSTEVLDRGNNAPEEHSENADAEDPKLK